MTDRDIVAEWKRQRDALVQYEGDFGQYALMDEAVAEIERLRGEVAYLRVLVKIADENPSSWLPKGPRA